MMSPPWLTPKLFLKPDVLKAPAVEDAVHHHPQAFDPGLPTGGEPQVIDDRSCLVLLQSPVDLPHQPLSLPLVALHGLLLEHFLQLGITIPGVVTLRATCVVLIELCIRVIGSDPCEIEADRVIFAIDLGKPVGGLDRVELAGDVDLFELVDEDDRRISEDGNVSLRNLDLEPLVGPVTELFNDRTGFGAVLLHIGIIAGQTLEHVWRQAPHPLWRRLHCPANVALPLGEDIYKGLAVQRQRQRPSHLGIVEGWGITVDDQIGVGIRGPSSQIACGAWLLTSLSRGTVTSNGNVMSNLPAINERIAVDRFGITVYSIPSR